MNVSVHGYGKIGSELVKALDEVRYLDIYVADPILQNDIVFEGCSRRVRTINQAPVDVQFDASFIIVPTPTGSDNQFMHDCVHAAIAAAREGRGSRVIIIMSTLNPAHMDEFTEPDLVYAPVMVQLGDVLNGLVSPEYQLVGGISELTVSDAIGMFTIFQKKGVHYRRGSLVSIAWTKLLVNCMLSVKISVFNALWVDLKRVMSDQSAEQVLRFVAGDKRIGVWGSIPGRTPGGPCLPRDMKQLHELSQAGSLTREYITCLIDEVNQSVVWEHETKFVGVPANEIAVRSPEYKPGIQSLDNSIGYILACKYGFQTFSHLTSVEDIPHRYVFDCSDHSRPPVFIDKGK